MQKRKYSCFNKTMTNLNLNQNQNQNLTIKFKNFCLKRLIIKNQTINKVILYKKIPRTKKNKIKSKKNNATKLLFKTE
jgi:hypothetical protein